MVLGKGCLLFGTCTCPPSCNSFISGSSINPENSPNIYCRFLDHPGDVFTCEETDQYFDVICEDCEMFQSRRWAFEGEKEDPSGCAPETEN
ncbi:MAG: hypothetical protein ACFFBD_01305 [Candidatus Hodarchaeota archaeon]